MMKKCNWKGKSMPVKRKEIDEAKFPEYNKLVIELAEEEEKKEEKYKQLEFEFDEDLVAPI
jgi:hypothetical protein|tara:strand:+ start:929 stop:1111 length:183 start_codon:yes stop_codon:yes gene_type:complete